MARKRRSAARRAAVTAAGLGVLIAAPGAAAQSPLTPAPPAVTPPVAVAPVAPAPDTPGDEVVPATALDPLESLQKPDDRALLSDEKTITRWANAQDTSTIRSRPSTSGARVARMHFLTEDGIAEVYVVLEGQVDSAKNVWLKIRIPARANNLTGWVRQESLSDLRVVRTRLLIVRTSLRATLFKNDKPIWTARVGIGKSGTPTPAGDFYVRERLRGSPGSAYGPWAFGTSAYSRISDWVGAPVVGIHGTNQPGLIPGRPSHGCVRMRNDKIRALARLMPIGTPVKITD
jgi:hypothetical protein